MSSKELSTLPAHERDRLATFVGRYLWAEQTCDSDLHAARLDRVPAKWVSEGYDAINAVQDGLERLGP